MRKIVSVVTIFLVALCSTSCGDEEERYILPAHPVNFRINLRGVDAILAGPGSFKEYINGSYPILAGEYLGFGGLLVVNSIYATNTPDLLVYDLACPKELNNTILVTTSKDALTAKCNKCGNVFDLMNNGKVKNGSAKMQLQRYSISRSSDADIFYVTR